MSATRPVVVGVCGLVLFVVACGSDRETQVAGTSLEGPTLTVRDPVVRVNGTSHDPGSPIPLEPGSEIAADDSGVGIVEYSGLVELELFLGGTVQLPEAVTNTAQISLLKGHLHVTSHAQSGIGTAVDLGERLLTILEPGTEFVVCQAPNGATCVYVVTGSLRWDGDGDTWMYTAHQGTFARAGEPPISPTCPTQPVFARWLEDALAGQGDQTLSDLISQYEAGSPCPQGSQNTAPAPETTATSAAVAPGDTETEPGAGEEDTEAEPRAAGGLPSGEGMVPVTIEEPTIGTDDPAGNPEHYEARRTIPGPIEFYIDERATTNREFRDWLARVAGNDPEVWLAQAPKPWLDNAPDDAWTQARYPDSEGDDPVAGIRLVTASAYCTSLNKRLPTEIEWELAANTGRLIDVDQPRQDWVTNWEEYGPGVGAGESVLRGTDPSLRPDRFYRLKVQDTAEHTVSRADAGVRCAAEDVQEGTARPATAGNVVESYNFCSEVDWPVASGGGLLIGFHPPCDYHVEANEEHAQVVVIREQADLEAGVTVESNAFVLRHEGGPGSFRFGLALGSRDAGYVLFTLRPDLTAQQYEWCIAPMGGDLTQALAASPESYASAIPPVRADRHAGERCAGGLSTGTVDYSALDDPVRLVMSLEGDSLAAQIDTTQIDPVLWAGPVDSYGFFAEIFHMDLAHIHYEDLTITTP